MFDNLSQNESMIITGNIYITIVQHGLYYPKIAPSCKITQV